MSEPESEITHVPQCPYCGRYEDDYYSIKDGEECECYSCGALYTVTVYDIKYSTEGKAPPPADNDEGSTE